MDGEQILRGYHARHPGATSQVLGGSRVSATSSYDLLVRTAETAPAGATILDLACGDGYLLELLARARPDARLIGIDMSEAELVAARRRLGPDADLRCERAQALSLRDGSVDHVLCHMALMLMSPLGPVLDQIARVLAPGGAFAAVVGSSGQEGAAWALFREVHGTLLANDDAAMPHVGDPRTGNASSLQALIAEHGAFRDARVEPAIVTLDGTPDQIVAFFSLTYRAFALGDARPALEEQLRAGLPSLQDARGLVPFQMQLLLLLAVRA
jgi:ubiquinone/menaquinone biosynthesis C-methylase UbiE